MSQSHEEVLWRFVRGDMEAAEFESWLYASHEDQELRLLLGADLVLELLQIGYNEPRSVQRVGAMLREHLLRSLGSDCRCLSWKDLTVLPLGYDPVDERSALLEEYFDYTVIARRTPWLECVRCKACGQAWYLATDTVHTDAHRLLRLDAADVDQIGRDVWPTVFDGWDAVWPDSQWLAAFGYASLEAWLETHPPDPQDAETR